MKILDEIKKGVYFEYWFRHPEKLFEVRGLSPSPKQVEVLRLLPDPKFERALISAPRGGGKTVLLASIALWTAVPLSWRLGRATQTAIVAGSRAQALQLYSHILEFLKHPLLGSEVQGEPLKTITVFKNGSSIVALPRSESAIRGLHPDLMIIDESVLAGAETILTAEDTVLWNKPYQRIIHASTPHVFDSYFVEMLLNEKRFPHYRRFTWSWRDCPWKPAEKYEQEASSKPKRVIEPEWEGRPFAGEEGVFSKEDVWQAGVETLPQPVEGAVVNIGVDWGFKHPTVVTVVQFLGDVAEVLEVKEFKEADPDESIKFIQNAFYHYKAFRVYSDSEDVKENYRLKSRGVLVEPVSFKAERSILEANLIELLKSRKIRIWVGFDELRRQLANYSPNSNYPRDYVDSLLLACRRTDLATERFWIVQEPSWEARGEQEKEEERFWLVS